jgi:hypothetical protein
MINYQVSVNENQRLNFIPNESDGVNKFDNFALGIV